MEDESNSDDCSIDGNMRCDSPALIPLNSARTIHGIYCQLLLRKRNLQHVQFAGKAMRVDVFGLQIRVFCRVKPHLAPVVACGLDGVSVKIVVDSKEHPFTFDKVFGPHSSQAQVFNEVSDLVQSALDGFKVGFMHLT